MNGTDDDQLLYLLYSILYQYSLLFIYFSYVFKYLPIISKRQSDVLMFLIL